MTTTPPSDAGAEAVLESLAAQVNKQLDMSDDALFGYLKAYGNPETPPHEVENAYRAYRAASAAYTALQEALASARAAAWAYSLKTARENADTTKTETIAI